MKLVKKIKGKKLSREFLVDSNSIDVENRRVKFALSSEEPYLRFFGYEILGHNKNEADLSRLQNRAPILAEHDFTKQIGVIEEATLDHDGVIRCVGRFSKNQLATEYFNDIVDGIRGKVSVGYEIRKMVVVDEIKNEETGEITYVYRVVDWCGYEGSIVAVAADDTVGVGRAMMKDDDEENEIEIVEIEDDTKNLVTDDDDDEEDELDETAADEDAEQEDKNIKSNIELNVKEVDLKEKEKNISEIVDNGLVNSENRSKINNNNYKDNNNMNELLELGRKYGKLEMAVEFLEKGKTVADFTNALLEEKASQATKMDAGEKRELDSFDLNAYMRELADENRNGKNFGFAKELDQSFKGRSKNGGLLLPRYVFAKAQKDYQISGGNPQTGGNYTPNTFRPDYIDALWNNSVVLGIASVYPSGVGSGSVEYPIVNGKHSFQYVGENTRADTSVAGVDKIKFSPKTISGRTTVSRELMLQSAIRPIQGFITSQLLKKFDEFRDNELLNGSGVTTPVAHIQGIANLSGINTVTTGATSGALNYAKVVELESDILFANAGAGRMAYITNSKVAGYLKTKQKFANYGAEILAGNEMNGYQVMISNQVASAGGTSANQNTLMLVNGEHLHYMEWDGYELVANPWRLGAGQVEFELFASMDFQVGHPQGISICSDIVL